MPTFVIVLELALDNNLVVRLVIDQLTAPRKCFSIIMVFDVFDSSVYKGSSLAILAYSVYNGMQVFCNTQRWKRYRYWM